MRTRARKVQTEHTPQTLAGRVRRHGGLALLETCPGEGAGGRYSFLAVAPFLAFRSTGARCEIQTGDAGQLLFGNPWRVMDALLARYDLPAEADVPFPTGACIGYWGYELRQFVEPKLRPHPVADLPLPDCWLGFYDSLVVFDHEAGGAWIVATGLQPDGSRSAAKALASEDFWRQQLESEPVTDRLMPRVPTTCVPELSREDYLRCVVRAQAYIRQGDIYQANLAQRWEVRGRVDAWALYRRLAAASPAPYAACLEDADFGVVSASPELFLRGDGLHVETRPIKGTRPRGTDAFADAALAAELRASAKEQAELTMITDLLRNDLGRVCSFGSVRVPELARLEAYAQVQHLVATVEGRLRGDVTHLQALEKCFPGGSVTGAPKFRAMQIIDELEPFGRGPYTGALGYLGFNRQSQLSIIIRSAFCAGDAAWFYTGSGIVADSDPAAEYAETLAKAGGLLEVLDSTASSQASLASVDAGRLAA